MRSTTKSSQKKRKSGAASVVSFADAEALLYQALRAEPKDLKVPISLRLDGDVYLELKKRAEAGASSGKYQAHLNEILRHHLFGERMAQSSTRKTRRVRGS